MMKFFDEIKAAKEKYDGRIEELFAEKRALEEKLLSLQTEFNVGLEKDALGITPFKDEAKLEKAIEETRLSIGKMNEKIDIVKRGKKQAIVNKIPFVKSYTEQARADIDREWNEGMEDINRIKAEFILRVAALSEIAKKADKLFAEHNALIEEVADPNVNLRNTGELQGSYKDAFSMPWNPNDAWGTAKLRVALSVPDWACKNAYTGLHIPGWIKHYETTGEIDFSKGD